MICLIFSTILRGILTPTYEDVGLGMNRAMRARNGLSVVKVKPIMLLSRLVGFRNFHLSHVLFGFLSIVFAPKMLYLRGIH